MMIFLSYASAQRDLAEEIKLALVASGHNVFFDRDSLPSGDDYHLRIRKAVAESEAFIFLISPQSVARGCYALTELRYAREKWPNPRGKVLPVMIEKTDFREIPPYLKAVTVLEPEGNAPAEITAEIHNGGNNGDPLIAGTLKKIVRRFIDVLTQPRRFIRKLAYNDEHALFEASLFAVCVSVINLIILLPAYRVAGVEAETSTHVLADTILTLFFLFLNGSIYHICAKLVRGHGTYQSSIVAIFYLTAFSVLSRIFALPLSVKIITATRGSLELPSLSEMGKVGQELLQSPSGLICSVLLVATVLYRWICTIGVFMIIHEVGRAKGVLIGLLGSGLSWVVFFTVEGPAYQLLQEAFSRVMPNKS